MRNDWCLFCSLIKSVVMFTRTTSSMGNDMRESYILCKYSEDENRQVRLIRVGEFDTIGEARERARSLSSTSDARFVVLTELLHTVDSRAS